MVPSWRCCRPWPEVELTHLTSGPLDADRLLRAVAAPDRGGLALFVGTVRDHHEGKRVLRLEYTAYPEMAEAEFERILREAEGRWPVRATVVHRLGILEVGEASVVVAAGGAHRDEAFAACRYVIEELKRRVPIWKREHYATGETGWVESGADPAGVEAP
jgi:molybdopterin synthase catalytic subunit